MPDPVHRKSSRHHRSRRVARWIRALGPLLLLIAAGLLSAGVVRVVEVTTPARGLAPDPSRSLPGPPRSRIDFESFDKGLYQELQELDRNRSDDLSLDSQARDLDLLRPSLATSLLGRRIDEAIAPFRAEVEIRASSLYEGPRRGRADLGDPAPASSSDLRPAPEPGTTVLFATGLGALVRRATRLI